MQPRPLQCERGQGHLRCVCGWNLPGRRGADQLQGVRSGRLLSGGSLASEVLPRGNLQRRQGPQGGGRVPGLRGWDCVHPRLDRASRLLARCHFATHSPLNTHHLQLTSHHAPRTTPNAPRTMNHSALTTHHSPPTTYTSTHLLQAPTRPPPRARRAPRASPPPSKRRAARRLATPYAPHRPRTSNHGPPRRPDRPEYTHTCAPWFGQCGPGFYCPRGSISKTPISCDRAPSCCPAWWAGRGRRIARPAIRVLVPRRRQPAEEVRGRQQGQRDRPGQLLRVRGREVPVLSGSVGLHECELRLLP